ncbi:MAG TPA: PilT/PilU family type 4a pilus ATPase [Rariglobus sp.]|jgi:twitching motility protein PilT|nr:PilT/PilU family type 4a pilus ATPase [Rariglobus sp.]
MQNEIRWLVRLGLDQGLFTRAHAITVRNALGEQADLMDFAQKLIDDGHVADAHLDTLEKVAGLAFSKGKAGPPADDPFDTDDQVPPPQKTSPRPASGGTAPPFMVTSAADGPPKLPKLSFATIGDMDDASLSAALRSLLSDSARYGASDLHLSAGTKPFIRHDRKLVSISDHVLKSEEALRLNTALLAPHQKKLFLEQKDFDYALALDATNRYRVNLMFHKGGAAGAYRMVPAKIPRLGDLGLRNLEVVKKLLSYHNGLILVTGPVGAGKTTTLAALVAELNETRTDHIITVEDPIEVVQPAKGCNITQREVGPHTKSFATALKGALREDPDVIIIGELRDLETIEMAITASETGHLVIGTMHTSDAATTLNRLLDVFPPGQQSQIRASVAESLRGIICQRLLPGTDGGLVLACEMLVANPAVSNLIREGKTQGLRNVLETGVREGMCLMENVVLELYQQRTITADTARLNIVNRQLRAKIS